MIDVEPLITPIPIDAVWTSTLIGIFSLLHIVPAALSIGFMFFAPVLEWRGRSRPFDADLARSLTRFTVLVFSVSTVLAVIMVELMIGLLPVTTMWLWNRFHAWLYLAMAAFGVGLLALYPYYHWWDQLRRRSVIVHLSIGVVAALGMFTWVVVLDGMGSYMLTPSVDSADAGRMGSATWIPLVVHRLFADLVIAGYTVAGFAAWRMSRTDRQSDRAYYAHALRSGWMLGLAGLLLQPLSGLVYAESIARASPSALDQIAHGRFQGLLYLQFVLVGLLFLGNQFVIRQVREGRPAQSWMGWRDVSALVAVLGMVVLSGQTDIRRLFLFALVGLILWSLLARPRVSARQEQDWTTPMIRIGCIGLAIVSIVLYVTMGVIRETMRHPDTVRGLITLDDRVRNPLVSREEP